jgi:hypothetical protein
MQKLHKHVWSAAKEDLFLGFVQQVPQRVVLPAISSAADECSRPTVDEYVERECFGTQAPF